MGYLASHYYLAEKKGNNQPPCRKRKNFIEILRIAFPISHTLQGHIHTKPTIQNIKIIRPPKYQFTALIWIEYICSGTDSLWR